MTQQTDAIWILSGLLCLMNIMGIILWWSIKSWIGGVNAKIDKMGDELRIVGNKNIGFEKDINRIERDYNNHEHRLQDHADRLRKVEQNQASCPNCTFK